MTTNPGVPEFSITRIFRAPQDLVWRAWTEAEELAHWLHPFGVSSDGILVDFRVGGRYRYTMTNDTTGETFPTGGEYFEIEPIERLVFTWGDPDAAADAAPVITLTLRPQGDDTELVFHLRGLKGSPGDDFVYDGWDEALTNFGRYLAGEKLD